MRTIIEGKAYISKLLGKQRIKDGVQYRQMLYLLSKECEDGLLLHNVITGQTVLLNYEERSIFKALPLFLSEIMIPLIENYFIVPVEFEEKFFVQNFRKLLRHLITPKGIKQYSILTTTNCNARCFYCFQSGYPRINMDKETADLLVNYMIRHKVKGPLYIVWFGGEPLVCAGIITHICEKLECNQIEFKSVMISNGYLFTEKLVDDAANKWNLRRVQITLDGTEEVYNRTKAFVSAADNPYRQVLNNIEILLSRKIHVNIRLNLGNHNSKDLFALVEELHRSIHHQDYLKVYAQVLFEHESFTHSDYGESAVKELYQVQKELNYRLKELGLYKEGELPSLRYHKCMADTEAAVAVYPDGKLFKCEHTIIGDEFGTISSDRENEEIIKAYSEPYEISGCGICPIYPYCIRLKKCIHASEETTSVICRQEVQRMTELLELKYKQCNAHHDNVDNK